jgi:hydrogenase nickel incorporation protein HypA/HybF
VVHEVAITESVIEAITARVGDTKVTRVLLEIGKLSGVRGLSSRRLSR